MDGWDKKNVQRLRKELKEIFESRLGFSSIREFLDWFPSGHIDQLEYTQVGLGIHTQHLLENFARRM